MSGTQTATDVFAAKYPEHMKLKAVGDVKDRIGDFVVWLEENGYHICERDGNEYWPTLKRIPDDLLAQYYDIDVKKIDREKTQMVDEIRAANARTVGVTP